jgi:hypothetical protein
LKGLPGRLLDLGGGAQSSIKSEQFEGFTQDATAIAMQGDRDCRERLFKQMFDKLGSADAPAVPKSGKPHVVIMTFTLDQRITRNANSILITAHFTIHNDGDATAEECYVKFWPLSTPDTTGDFLVDWLPGPFSGPKFGIAPKQNLRLDVDSAILVSGTDMLTVNGQASAVVECADNIRSRPLGHNAYYVCSNFDCRVR